MPIVAAGGRPGRVTAAVAFDVLVHLPHVSPADPDRDTLACAPRDAQQAFGHGTAG